MPALIEEGHHAAVLLPRHDDRILAHVRGEEIARLRDLAAVREEQPTAGEDLLQLGGPSDTDTRGRWIPTVSVEQYAATLASWYGVANSDLPIVFPNLGRFASANLGFMA